MQLLSSVLILYGWIVAGLLVLFLLLIGRFYEIKFGQKAYYQLFLLPLVLFLIAAMWDVVAARGPTGNLLLDFVGNPGPDLLWFLGGIALTGLCYSLYRTMMGGKK
ncbi:MAG: hypothetical protein ACUVWZ_00260 [Anaerolineae bacterium]